MSIVQSSPLRAVCGLAVVLFLAASAGCTSMQATGPGAGSSTSAAGYLADIRAANGLAPLASDPQLEKAALQQAKYMARSSTMKHTTGYGMDFSSRMAKNDISGPAAENIAAGRFDVAKVMNVWEHSPPHRRNMLDSRMNRFGLAYVRDGKNKDLRYWALVLAK